MISFAGVLQRFRLERFATHKIEDSSGSIFAGLYLVNLSENYKRKKGWSNGRR